MAQAATVSLRQIYRCQVLNQNQELMGTVDDVLFHPTKPQAVGFSIKPYRLGGIIALPTRYLLFENATFNAEGQLIVILEGQAPTTDKERKAAKHVWDTRAEKKLGFSWDESVIYYGQEVHTQGGTALGKVSDARFDLASGMVSVLQVTAGTGSDALLGKRAIPGALVRGFDATTFAVICDNAAADILLDGGAAEQAGRVVATAAEAASDAGKKIGEVTIKGAAKAAVYGERAIKQAAQTPAGQKTKTWLKGFVKDFKDAMNDEE